MPCMYSACIHASLHPCIRVYMLLLQHCRFPIPALMYVVRSFVRSINHSFVVVRSFVRSFVRRKVEKTKQKVAEHYIEMTPTHALTVNSQYQIPLLPLHSLSFYVSLINIPHFFSNILEIGYYCFAVTVHKYLSVIKISCVDFIKVANKDNFECAGKPHKEIS